MVVSNMSNPAGSVAVFARPDLPKTVSTSGIDFRIRSWVCMISRAFATLTPGSVTGMYSTVPSSRRGMNSLPMRCHGIHVRMKMARLTAMTGTRLWRTKSITGR
jgi:hypothetical protein